MEETDLGMMLRSALSIDDIDQLRLSRSDGISVIWVDISERPDLAALAARSTQEAGDAVCTWFYGNPGKRNINRWLACRSEVTHQYRVCPVLSGGAICRAAFDDREVWKALGCARASTSSPDRNSANGRTHLSHTSPQLLWPGCGD